MNQTITSTAPLAEHRPSKAESLNPVQIACAAARQFQIYGELLGLEPYGSGHINDTYCARFDQGGAHIRYIVQRINHSIFKNPEALMDNIRRVTIHLKEKIPDVPDRSRRVLTLVPALNGQSFYRDSDGNYWRAYLFIEKARTHDVADSPRQAFEAARAFGQFQSFLSDLPLPRLNDTIPDFHHAPKRFAALEKAIQEDVLNRAKVAMPEIEFAFKRRDLTGVLPGAGLPLRVTHNDTKLNNIMLDDNTGEGICVIDLDTVMPGLAAYDFGDMVRTTTCPVREDERDLSRVQMQLPMFEALLRGYLASASAFLAPAEKQFLVFSGRLITFEIGVRFLTDFLSGDTYFKVHRHNHNLDRCRTQFKLVESIERQEEQMNRLVEQCK